MQISNENYYLKHFQLTSNNGLADSLKEINVEDGTQHSLHDTDLTAEPQRQQHKEKYDRPKWSER